MLMLLFSAGGDRYAIPAHRSVEVVPLVELKRIAHSPPTLAGLLNYRGQIIPVLDLCRVLGENSYSPLFSTRIIIVSLSGAEKSSLLGLVAEGITDTIYVQAEELRTTQFFLKNAPYLGEMIRDSEGNIQCLNIEPLFSQLSQIQSPYLLSQQES